MIHAEDIIDEIIQQHSCCKIWTVPLSLLARRDKCFFNEFAPTSKTAIVLGHHIVTKSEWTCYIKEDGSEHCEADDHTAIVCEQLKCALEEYGFCTQVVPYPGETAYSFDPLQKQQVRARLGSMHFCYSRVGAMDTFACARY